MNEDLTTNESLPTEAVGETAPGKVINYYTDEDFFKAKKRRNNMLFILLGMLAVYLAISATFLVFYLRLPYKSSKITPLKIGHHAVTVVALGAMFFFLCVPYKRARNYYKMLFNMKTCVRENNTGSFFEYDETLQEKDGVDCKALIFLEWNKYKNDVFERKVLVFYDKPFPELKEKDTVRFITQGNVLISYEIL